MRPLVSQVNKIKHSKIPFFERIYNLHNLHYFHRLHNSHIVCLYCRRFANQAAPMTIGHFLLVRLLTLFLWNGVQFATEKFTPTSQKCCFSSADYFPPLLPAFYLIRRNCYKSLIRIVKGSNCCKWFFLTGLQIHSAQNRR